MPHTNCTFEHSGTAPTLKVADSMQGTADYIAKCKAACNGRSCRCVQIFAKTEQLAVGCDAEGDHGSKGKQGCRAIYSTLN